MTYLRDITQKYGIIMNGVLTPIGMETGEGNTTLFPLHKRIEDALSDTDAR